MEIFIYYYKVILNDWMYNISALVLTRPFFLLEWEKGRRQLSRTELEHRLYSLQRPEIDKEAIKMMEDYVVNIRPKIVFLDGSSPSEELHFCSPEAAKKYTERDYFGVEEDSRAIISRMAGAEVIYLDEGFERINPYYKTQKRKIEEMFLIDEIIEQIKEKRGYIDDAQHSYKKHFEESNHENMNEKEAKEWLKDVINVYNNLLPQKECALSVGGIANFPEECPAKSYTAAEDVLKKAKDLKKIQSLRLEDKIQEGREDFWMKKVESRGSELYEGSKILFITEAFHMGIENEDSSNVSFCIEKFHLPISAIAKWGLMHYQPPKVGNFHTKLSILGPVKIVDLTQKNVEKILENRWSLKHQQVSNS